MHCLSGYSRVALLLIVVLLVLCVVLPSWVASRRVHRCFVARKIREHTAYKRLWQIKQFLCIIDMVSNFNISLAVLRSNGQRTVGIFQFPSKWYCVDKIKGEGRAGKCHQLCEAFLDEDLVNDVRCASIATNQYGFRFWKGWEDRCFLRNIDHYLEGCAL
ncbi:lysozyme C-3-like [Tropilaelaps mercedesae]|uniref:lysozyme n=1 Tax=Tropilaelaps mercedesae TaxID=418985 RepID=A0A1V9XSG1_9ACAR|nr:lysozyme C-3-like [Tropilaelaps mercedesae]